MPTVLVTGANRGVGLEFARQYAAAGWRVHACCRAPGAADDLAEALSRRDAVIHPLDVTDLAAIHAVRDALDDEPVDVLINNAGVGGGKRQGFGAVDYDTWEDVIRINAFAPYRMVEALVGQLEASRMRVVANLSSRMGSIGENDTGGSYIYRSSKTALNMVTVNLAFDLRDRGITVLALHPGWVKTDMGGPNARITPATSVTGLRKVIEGAGPADSGRFFSYDGSPIAW